MHLDSIYNHVGSCTHFLQLCHMTACSCSRPTYIAAPPRMLTHFGDSYSLLTKIAEKVQKKDMQEERKIPEKVQKKEM